jgi:hypothetical protein
LFDLFDVLMGMTIPCTKVIPKYLRLLQLLCCHVFLNTFSRAGFVGITISSPAS